MRFSLQRQRMYRWLFCYVFLLIIFQSKSIDAKHWQQHCRRITGGRRRLQKDNLPNAFEYNSPNSQFEDEYYEQSEISGDPRTRKRPSRRFQDDEDDLVTMYTSSSTSKMMVAASTGISSFIITHFLLLMIIGQSHWIPLLVAALICSSFVFLQGDFADFTRSLGVFSILLSKNFTIHKFLPKFLRQFHAAIHFSSRKPFPPSTSNNPWRYIPLSETEDLQFSMTNTLLTMIIVGAIFGWNVVKPIPLFPSWIGAILGASIIGYGSTLTNARGDFLRFLGYTLVMILSEVMIIADDVQLRAKTSIILGQLFFFCRGIDQQFHIINTLKRWISIFLLQFTTVLYSMRGEGREPVNHMRENSRRGGPNRFEGIEDEDNDYYEDDRVENRRVRKSRRGNDMNDYSNPPAEGSYAESSPYFR